MHDEVAYFMDVDHNLTYILLFLEFSVRPRVRAFYYIFSDFSNTFEYLQIMSLPASKITVQPSCNSTGGIYGTVKYLDRF